MNNWRTTLTVMAVLALLLGAGRARAHAAARLPAAPGGVIAGTAFTYQGRLNDGGSPATGDYDFEFNLYDADSGGALVAGPLAVDDVAVTDGYFTVRLDFGAGAFTGEGRWLEIAVRPGASGGAYTPLLPRQPLTAAPLALSLPGLYTQPNATSPNLIGGWAGNSISSSFSGSVIGGGGRSGDANTISGAYSVIGGGYANTISSAGSAVIGGGEGNTVDHSYAVVGGGEGNRAINYYATVSGGYSNTVAAGRGVIAGGYFNTVTFSSEYAAVGGGAMNAAGAYYATVGGGFRNLASGHAGAIGGGENNRASGDWGWVGGGFSNTAIGNYAAVGGGFDNRAFGSYATVGGGITNTASGTWSTVGGGIRNTASDNYTVVSGGFQNTADGLYAAVAGGDNNQALNNWAFVGGGDLNTASGDNATVAGGDQNDATGDHSFVGGGEDNTASSAHTVIGGGLENEASASFAAIGGGDGNTASASFAAIGGGYANLASGEYATAGGGFGNSVTGERAVVAGGSGNFAGGAYSAIPGGFNNTATLTGTLAAGVAASASHANTFVWADGTSFASTANNQFLVRASGGVGLGTNAPGGQLHVASSGNNNFPQVYISQTVTGNEYVRLRLHQNGKTYWDLAAGGTNNVFNIYNDGTNHLAILPDDATNLLFMSNGARLTQGGAWTNASDRDLKTAFAPVDPARILDALAALPLYTWQYRAEPESVRHLGPTAQDFRAAFGLGADDTSITTLDADGVALAAIQALHAENESLQARLAALEARAPNLPLPWLLFAGLGLLNVGYVVGRRRAAART